MSMSDAYYTKNKIISTPLEESSWKNPLTPEERKWCLENSKASPRPKQSTDDEHLTATYWG